MGDPPRNEFSESQFEPVLWELEVNMPYFVFIENFAKPWQFYTSVILKCSRERAALFDLFHMPKDSISVEKSGICTTDAFVESAPWIAHDTHLLGN